MQEDIQQENMMNSPGSNPATTSIPIQSASPDELPREKGWSYDELASIVGSLYLDSHHGMKVREDQFNAMIEEYDKNMLRVQAELKGKLNENENLIQQVATLRRELEKRSHANGKSGHSGPITPAINDGHHQVSDS